MNARRFEDFEANINDITKDPTSILPLTTKLERRRRIEEMEEEKRLRAELSEFA